MKTKEELNALKEEIEILNKKLHELTDEELAQVSGGGQVPENSDGIVGTCIEDAPREEKEAEPVVEELHEEEIESEPVVEEIHEEEPRVEIYEAPYTDPRTKQQVIAQFRVEAKDNGVAIGQVFGGLVIGKRGKDE